MKIYFHLRFVFEKVFVTANFTMDLNTATFEEMQSLAGIGHGRAQAIFDGRANLSRPLTLLDLLEMGIPADVVNALVDDLEIKAIARDNLMNNTEVLYSSVTTVYVIQPQHQTQIMLKSSKLNGTT